MDLWIGYIKTFPLEIGGQMGKSTYAMGVGVGVRSKRTCAYNGGGESNLSHFGAYSLAPNSKGVQ